MEERQTIYHELERLYNAIGARISNGGSSAAPSPSVAHIPMENTELAACVVTMDVPLRHPTPYIDCNQDDGKRVRTWWVGQGSSFGTTEGMVAGYYFRDRLKTDHPLHPLHPMMDALDARRYWLAVKFGEIKLPREASGFITSSIRSASILKAHKFKPLAFTGSAFVLESSRDGMHAAELLAIADRPTGAAAPQWMAKVLINFDSMLSHMKKSRMMTRQTDGGRSLILSQDAEKKVVDQFENLL